MNTYYHGVDIYHYEFTFSKGKLKYVQVRIMNTNLKFQSIKASVIIIHEMHFTASTESQLTLSRSE